MRMHEPEKILIILTGGTIDSTWNGKLDTVVVSGHSTIPEYFKSLILYAQVEFLELCMKDSRSLNADDIDRVKDACEKSAVRKIIITHGTYTMADTARFLLANLVRKDQTIVFTGSMVPLKGFDPTDAAFNLGYAISSVELLSPGIYLCMNGRSFRPDEVAKNIGEGKFYSVFDRKS